MKKAVICVTGPASIDVDGTAAAGSDGFRYVPRFYVPTGSRSARHAGPRVAVLVEDGGVERIVAEAVITVTGDGKLLLAEDVPAVPRFLEEERDS